MLAIVIETLRVVRTISVKNPKEIKKFSLYNIATIRNLSLVVFYGSSVAYFFL